MTPVPVPRAGALIWAVLLLAACTGKPPAAPPPPASPPDPAAPTAVVALADGVVLVVFIVDGRVVARGRVTPPARPIPGHVLAAGQGGGPVYVLTRDGVAAVDPGTLAVRRSYQLRAGVRYSSLVVGATTGRLYAFGEGRPTIVDPGGGIVGPDRGRAVDGLGATRPGDWFVYAAAVSPDERYAVLSYHGETDGADILPLADPPGPIGADLGSCDRGPDERRYGCVPEVHGLVAATDRGILAATGEGPIVALSFEGTVQRRWDHGLPGNHLMEFAVADDALFALGPCGYSGGLSRIDTGSGAVRVLVPAGEDPGPRTVPLCGDRTAALPGGPLAIVDGPRLRLVDPSTGAVRQTVELPADAVDVLVW